MAKMTKEELLKNRLNKARNLSMQHRWPEAKLAYENIIADLRPKVRRKKDPKPLDNG